MKNDANAPYLVAIKIGTAKKVWHYLKPDGVTFTTSMSQGKAWHDLEEAKSEAARLATFKQETGVFSHPTKQIVWES